MPTTIGTVVVFALALLPGAIGDYVWATINGVDWRQKDWQAALRFLAFSTLGLGLYVVLGLPFEFLPPVHIVPSTYSSLSSEVPSLAQLFIPYLGHIAFSGVVAAAAVGLDRIVCKLTNTTPLPSAWDRFIQTDVPERWVVVSLKTGDVYAGRLLIAENSAPANERDVVLGHPAKFEKGSKNYIVTSYSALFLPADIIQSIAAVRKDSELATEPAVNEPLFPGVTDDRTEDGHKANPE